LINNQKLSESGTQVTGAGLDINNQECVITIRVGTSLDLRLHDVFMKAIKYAQRSTRNRIVVDLDKTHLIFDSGLALLMMLNIRSWRKSCKVLIINCNPDLEQRIEQGLTAGMFNLSRGCQHLGYGSPSSRTEYG